MERRGLAKQNKFKKNQDSFTLSYTTYNNILLCKTYFNFFNHCNTYLKLNNNLTIVEGEFHTLPLPLDGQAAWTHFLELAWGRLFCLLYGRVAMPGIFSNV